MSSSQAHSRQRLSLSHRIHAVEGSKIVCIIIQKEKSDSMSPRCAWRGLNKQNFNFSAPFNESHSNFPSTLPFLNHSVVFFALCYYFLLVSPYIFLSISSKKCIVFANVRDVFTPTIICSWRSGLLSQASS